MIKAFHFVSLPNSYMPQTWKWCNQ